MSIASLIANAKKTKAWDEKKEKKNDIRITPQERREEEIVLPQVNADSGSPAKNTQSYVNKTKDRYLEDDIASTITPKVTAKAPSFSASEDLDTALSALRNSSNTMNAMYNDLGKRRSALDSLAGQIDAQSANLEHLASNPMMYADSNVTRRYASAYRDYQNYTDLYRSAVEQYNDMLSQFKTTAEQYNADMSSYRKLAGRGMDLSAEYNNHADTLDQEAKDLTEESTKLLKMLSYGAVAPEKALETRDQAQQYQDQAKAKMDEAAAYRQKAQGAVGSYYAIMPYADDYDTLSKPVTSRGGNARNASPTSDNLYNFINDVQGARETAHNTGGAAHQYGEYGDMTPYSYMSDDEIATYNYLYAKKGKEDADKFLDYIHDSLNSREGKAIYDSMSGVEKGLYWIPQGIDQWVSGMQQVFHSDALPTSAIQYAGQNVQQGLQELGLTDEEKQRNAEIREAVMSGDMTAKEADKEIKSSVWGKLAAGAYGLGTTISNMAPSIMVSYMTGGLLGAAVESGTLSATAAGQIAGATGSALMGGSAGGNAYNMKLKEGWTKDQARTYGMLVAASESLLQYFLGGIDQLGGALAKKGEKAVSDALLEKVLTQVSKMDSVFAKTALEFGSRITVKGLSEGIEEGLQEILEPVFAHYIHGDDIDIDWGNVTESFIMGFLASGILDAPGTMVDSVIANKSYRVVGDVVRKNGDAFIDEVIQSGIELGEKSEAYALATDIQQKLNDGKTVSSRELGELYVKTMQKAVEKAGAAEQTNEAAQQAPAEETDNKIGLQTYQENQQADREQRAAQAKTEFERSAILAGMKDAEISRIQRVSNALGTNVRAYYEAPDASGTIKNGYFDRDTGILYINAASENPSTQILSHEFTHQLEQTEGYNALAKQIIDRLTDEKEIDKRRTEIRDLYQKAGVALDTDGSTAKVDAEIVAEYIEKEILTDESRIRELVQDRTFGQRILDQIDKLLARFGNEDAQERVWLTNLRNNISAAMNEAGSTTETGPKGLELPTTETVEKTAPNTEAGKSIPTETDNRIDLQRAEPQTNEQRVDDVMKRTMDMMEFSISKLPDGRKYVKADRQVLFGSDPEAWREQLESYINNKIRHGENVQLIADDGDVLTLTEDTAAKVASPYDRNGRLSEKMYETKANAGAHIDELAQVSTRGKKNKPDFQGRHGEKARDGWNYRPAFFQDFDGQYYLLTLSVQQGSDGKAVYNIGGIEERSLPEIIGSSVSDGAPNGDASSETNIAEEAPNVKRGNEEPDNSLKLPGNENPYSISTRTAQQNRDVVQQLRNYLNGDITKLDLQRYVDTIDETETEDAAEPETETDGAQQILNEARRENVSVDEYLRRNWEQYEYDGELNEDARRALDTERRGNLREKGVTLTNGSATRQYSVSTWTPTEKESVISALVKKGFDEETARKWANDVSSIAAIIAADRARLDFNAADNQTFLKKNQEYTYTADASTLCDKRRPYQGTFNEIQHRLPDAVLTSDDLIRLQNMMKEMGYTAPCGVCYVESRRRHLGRYAQEWLYGYNGEYIPSLDEVTTTDGLEKLRHEHPQTYTDFVKAMKKIGVNNPKVVELRTAYRGEVRRLSPSTIAKLIRIGGLRLQSFSDFETPHLLDMMQLVMDMASKGLTSQAYTKVPNFAWVFGDTGIKINLSLIAEGNGLNPDGTLRFSSTEGMDIDEALKLRERYGDNVGTILVGVNDAHILAAMADDRIDFIIPFHKSGWGTAELEAMGMSEYEDYTSEQNEKDMATGKVPEGGNIPALEYWDFDKTGKENAEEYLRLCAEQNRIPKFSRFLVDNGDGSFSLQPDGSTDGYWKTLTDFRMYNNEGKGAPQRAVTPNFNMEEATRVLGEYEGGADTLPVAQDVVDRFIDEYNEKHGGTQSYSISKVVSEISRQDVNDIQSIGVRKSVNQFTTADIQKTKALAAQEWRILGPKSPFFRAFFGDWRENDITPVQTADTQGSKSGPQHNDDTEWDINISGQVFNETKSHNASKNKQALPYLPYINDIVKKAVLLDSFAMDKSKSPNSLLMHSLYAVADIGNGPELLKLYVEEMADPNYKNTTKRAYQLQNIEKASSTGVRVQGNAPSSITNVQNAIKNVADLFAAVKNHDSEFQPIPTSKIVGQDGKPIIVYHGTNATFDAFDTTKTRSHMDIQGSFFSPWEIDAGGYGENVGAYYLNIKNPAPEGVAYKALNRFKGQKDAGKKARDYLISLGYDGVNNSDEEYIAFYPEQIKSATDNIGTFDKNNSKYSYSVSRNNQPVRNSSELLDLLTDMNPDNTRTSREDIERMRQKDLDDLWRALQEAGDILEPRTNPDDKVSTRAQKKQRTAGEKVREGWSFFKRKMIDSGEAVTRIGKAVKDPHLYHYYNMARASSNAATSMITNEQTDIYGHRVGKGLNEIMETIRNKGEDHYKKLQLYLFHMHNIDRMSRFNQEAIDSAQAAFAEFKMTNPELNRYSDAQIRRMSENESDPFYFEACEYMDRLNALQHAENTRNKPVFGFDVSAEDSKAIADQLLRENPEFADEAQEIYDYIENLLRYRVDSGLITEDDYQTLKQVYPHYVPTFRSFENEATDTRQKNKVQIGSTVKRATGGTEKLMPLHKALAQQTMSVVREGSKNRFGQRLLNSNAQKATPDLVRHVQEYESNFAEDTFDTPEDQREELKKGNTFIVREGGKQWEMEVSPALFEAVKALSPDANENNFMLRVIRGGNNLFKELVTGYNPTFLVRNFMRDLQDAGIYSKDLSKFAQQYPQAVAQIAKDGEYWRQYKALGGTYSTIFDYETGETEKSGWLKRNTLGRIEALNMAIEQAPRLAEFMATVKNAEADHGTVTMDDLMEAMYNAADVTVNFGRSGTVGKVLNANFVPFLNPGIQGFEKMIRNVAETKGAKNWARLAIKAAVLGIAPTLINALIYHDEDDWDEIKDRDKDIYYLFKIGDHTWLKLPKGRTLSLLGMAADRAIDLAKGEDVDWGGVINTAASQVAPANPLENNIFQAAYDTHLFNKDNPGETWYGSDIESQRLQGYAPGERYDASTDVVSKWLGKTFNLSPKKINYLLDQYSGVVGDALLPLLTPTAERDMFSAAFTLDTAKSNRLSNDFYEMADELQYAKNGPEATGADAVAYRYWNKQSSAISEVNKAIREIEADETLSDKDKRELTKVQYLIRNELMKNAMDSYEKFADAAERYYYDSDIEDEDDRIDYAYREANREILGAEYALKTYNKDVYQTAQQMKNDAGISYDEFYDFYFDMKDIKETGYEGSNAKRDLISSLNMTDAQKTALYQKYVSSSRDGDIEAFKDAGLDFDTYLEAQNEYAAVDAAGGGAGQKRTEFARWVYDQDMTQDQRETVLDSFNFYSHIPAEQGKYEDFLQLGIDDNAAYDIAVQLSQLEPVEGKTTVSDMQKWQVVTASELPPAEQLKALEAITDESAYRKFTVAYDYDITPATFVYAKETALKYDSNQDGTPKNAEVEAALDSIGNGVALSTADGQSVTLTNRDRAILWQLIANTTSAKNNPYSSAIGQEVLNAVNAAKEAAKQEKTEESTASDETSALTLPTAGTTQAGTTTTTPGPLKLVLPS